MFNDNQPEFIALRDIVSENTSQLVIWIGAGLSAPAGLPTWNMLKEILERNAIEQARSMGEEGHNFVMEKVKASKSLKDDIWTTFNLLEEALGKTVFRDIIDKHLTPTKEKEIPEGYKYIWKLNPKGVISLNLDDFATRSFHSEIENEALHKATGKAVGKRLNILSSPLHFVVNLHGIHGDYDSWVFRKSDLVSLLEDYNYKRFVENILSSFRVLFIGITADDEATGGFISDLLEKGVKLGTHFWVTDRNDFETEKWARRNNIQIIRYNADDNHAELKEFFDKICSFLPKEEISPPVIPSTIDLDLGLPEPGQIAKMDSENIRRILNSHAARILKEGTPEAYVRYKEFRKKYGLAIHIADFAEPNTDDNIIFGYTLIEEVGSGGFSTVYCAEKEGERFAVKKFRKGRIGIPGMIECFRRGVTSMKILTEESVDGVVPYKEAYEIPPCLVMDIVNGPNLREVVESNQLSLKEKLKIALDVTSILRKGHELDKIVLHRDVRPGNVMLEDFYDRNSNFKVVVLDFDLSWYKGAVGESVKPANIGWENYHAPEQIKDIPGVSTRNAKVDSFGLGMTMFFLLTGKEPEYDRYVRDDYLKYLVDTCSCIKHEEWESLPLRISRLIYNATKPEQDDRLSITDIENELNRIFNMCYALTKYNYSDFYAEEILRRSSGGNYYDWYDNKLCGEIILQSGFCIGLSADEVTKKVTLHVHLVSKGQEGSKKIGKFLYKKQGVIKDTLKKGGWKYIEFFWDKENLDVEYYIKVSNLVDGMNDAVKSLSKCVDILHFR